MSCYCANYYGSINCQNKVSHFGDRCALCLTTNLKSSATPEKLIELRHVNERWYENSRREQLRREEERSRRERLLRVIE